MGVFVFVIGGVVILIPTISVIIAEWFAGWSNAWLRVIGLANLGLAYVFYLGAKVEFTPHVKGAIAALARYFG
jgi:hypothetical protein